MSLRFHEIAEGGRRILNPFNEEKLLLLGRICGVDATTRHLDLASGKGELLCRWASRFGESGIGVDISAVFHAAAGARAEELGVADRVSFARGDAGAYSGEHGSFDVVSCIGATWIGGGLAGTVELMRPLLRDGGLLVIGEPYWTDPPPEAAHAALGLGPQEFVTLEGTLDRFTEAGVDLVEMVLANSDDWDRYAAAQWMNGRRWLHEHPDDPEAAEFRTWSDNARSSYCAYGRRYLGWGVFILQLDS